MAACAYFTFERNAWSRWPEIGDHGDPEYALILDYLAYVTKDQTDTSALLELISTRYERRSMIMGCRQCWLLPSSDWSP
jgi:hypothetical protein